jgi:hypothetical protein
MQYSRKVSYKDLPKVWRVECETRSGKKWTKDFSLEIHVQHYCEEMQDRYNAKIKAYPIDWNGESSTYEAAYLRARDLSSLFQRQVGNHTFSV